jgi:hypothetical protein
MAVWITENQGYPHDVRVKVSPLHGGRDIWPAAVSMAVRPVPHEIVPGSLPPETRDEKGRFCLEQDTNAYGILPTSHGRGFVDDEAPPPHPSTWGAMPPLPDAITQAIVRF